MNFLTRAAAVAVLLLVSLCALAEDRPIPALTGRVVDETETLTTEQKRALAAKLQTAAKEVLDISGETAATKQLYGIDDPATADGVDFSWTAGTDEIGKFDVGLPFDIEPGQIVTVTQETTIKSHVVLDLRVTLMNPLSDTISGVGAPSTETAVDVWTDSHVVAQSHPMSNGTGAWTADFSPFDILPGMWSTATQADADGDTTMIVGRPPTFLVFRDWNGLVGSGWPAEVNVVVTADDPQTVTNPDSEQPLATNADGSFEGGWFPGLQPGWLITVTDGQLAMTHTVRAVSIIDVDPATDIVRGTADPGAAVWVAVSGGSGLFVTADDSGEWVAPFSGVEDIVVGSDVGVQQTDDNGNGTYFGYAVPFPPIPIQPGTSLTTEGHGTQSSGTPTVFWHDQMTVSTAAGSGGIGTATLTTSDGYVQTITLAESPGSSGAYTGTFDPPSPHHGTAVEEAA